VRHRTKRVRASRRRLNFLENAVNTKFREYPFQLDFSHLVEKGVGYARHQSPLKEVIELRTLPPKMVQALSPFAPLFSRRVFRHVQVLVAGAILAPGRRTVASALRALWAWTRRSASTATTGF
jgi:hypothetical protein